MKKISKTILLAAFAALLAPLYGKEFFLVKEKKPSAVIVRPGNAGKEWEATVKFFNGELKRCTGTTLPIVKTAPAKGNFITFALETKRPLDKEDAYSITFPGKRNMKITSSPLSVRWAFNHILQKELGVFYLIPAWNKRYGAEVNHYPALKNAKVKRKAFSDAPIVPFSRLGSHKGGALATNWNARYAFMGTHMMAIDVFPVYKYGPDNSWPKEILPTLANGKKKVLPKIKLPIPKNIFHARKPVGGFWQPCWSNPATTRIAIENILEILAKDPNKKGINIDVNDMGGYCLCKDCRKAVGGKSNSIRYPDYSELYWKWVHDVAAAVCKKYPHVYFTAIAYCQVYDPPSFKLHKNVIPRICIETIVLADEKVAPNRYKMLKAWKEKAHQLDLYDYLYGADFFIAPRVYFRSHSAILKNLIKNYNLRSAYISSDARSVFQGPMQQIILNVLWDPDFDVERFLDKWYNIAVGKKAAPYLKEYFDFWEKYWNGKEIRKTNWYKSINNAYMALGERNSHTYALKKGDLAYLKGLMDKVVKLAVTPAEKKRAALLKESFDYTYLACKGAFAEYFPADGEVKTKEEALEILKDAREGFRAAKKYAGHIYTRKLAVDKGRNLLPATVGAFSGIMKFVKDPAVRKEMEKLSKDKEIPQILQAQFKIALGAKVKNYFENGSFETKQPVYGKWGGGKVDTKYASDGKKSMRLRNGYCLYKIYNIPAGRTYLLLFDVFTEKGSAEGRLTYKLGFASKNRPGGWNTHRALVLTPGKWRSYSAVIRVPENVKGKEPYHVRIPIWFTKFEKNEPVWFDNVRLYSLEEIK